MKFKRMAIIGSVLTLFLLGGCASGVSQEEYDRLNAELQTMKTELEAAKTELETAEARVEDYQSKLAQAHAYAEAYDVNVDQSRFALGLPTKYGFVGYGKSPDFISSFVAKAEATGDTEFAEMVTRAFSLPWGDEKTEAWNEISVYWAERWLAVTEP